MRITFEIPPNIEAELRASGDDLNADARMAYLLSLYRRERITHDELSEALGLGFHQTEEVIKEHDAGQDFLTVEEFKQRLAFLRGRLRVVKRKRSGGDER
jgi:hypothetical protein